MASSRPEDIAVTRFRQYLRINTSQPNPDYAKASLFYQTYAQELGLDYREVQLPENRIVNLLTWKGQDPSYSSIILYCHSDVVPSFPEHWTYDPFSAHKDEKGNIYARGAQDMKCVGVQYLEAIRKLKAAGRQFKRTFHVTFCPDEEIGGQKGMLEFVNTDIFKTINVGFALDEGLASPEEEFRVFYGERNVWWLEVTCQGSPGHGSAFLENTAGEKVHRIIGNFLQFRAEQEQRLRDDPSLSLGDVTSVNLTILKGGVQFNVVPASMAAGFDIRIPPSEKSLDEMDRRIKTWVEETGSGTTCTFHHKTMDSVVTVTDSSNPWWMAFSRACQKMGIKIKREIFPAGTDGRYLRQKGIPVLGFSPMNHTPVLLHDHNEYLNEVTFLRGVDIYTEILSAVADV